MEQNPFAQCLANVLQSFFYRVYNFFFTAFPLVFHFFLEQFHLIFQQFFTKPESAMEMAGDFGVVYLGGVVY